MFYLFHGDDSHTQKQTVEKLLGRFGDQQMLSLNITKLEGKGLVVRDLTTACSAMPFLAPVRVVIVNDFLSSKPGKTAEKELLAFLPGLPSFTRLILLESKKISDRNAIAKLAQSDERGYVKLFERPKGSQIDRWIVNEVKKRGGQIAPRAANLLAANVGSDLEALGNEIEKLLLYKDNELIQPGDVELLSPYTTEANIFDLVDALGGRNGKRAVELLQQRLSEGAEPFQLFSMIVRQFRLIIQAKACLDQGMRPNEIGKAVGMHSFVAGKVTKQARSFSMPQLKRIYQHLLTIDLDAKTGRTDMATSLNLLVVSLAN